MKIVIVKKSEIAKDPTMRLDAKYWIKKKTEVKKCTNCNHECHCNKEHIDEYLDICPCDNCNCQTKKEKDVK